MEKEYFIITAQPWRISPEYTERNVKIALNSVFEKEIEKYSRRVDFKNKIMTVCVNKNECIPTPEHLIIAAKLKGEI